MTFRVVEVAGVPAIQCLLCGRVSELPGDVENKYCGRCHLFHDIVADARRLCADGGTHDCGEWRTHRGACAVCGRVLAGGGSMPIKSGDVVYLSTRDQHEAIRSVVTIASPDGRSLAIQFEAVLSFPGGAYVGSMPVLQLEDGRWIEILGGHEVRIEQMT